MLAPTKQFAVRLLGFAPAERARIEAILARAPDGRSYSCLQDDSLQEADLTIADADCAGARARLRRARPGVLQPALLVGSLGCPGIARLPRPVGVLQLHDVLAELLERRDQALALLAQGAQPPPERRARQAGAVLIVDKGGAFRDHVARVVGPRKLAVEWTDCPRTAIRLCDETPVSVLMINTSTPGVDPYAVSRAINEQDGALPTAVVFLLGPAFHYDSARARDAGVRGVLDKPVADRQLVATLDKLLAPAD